MSKTIKGGNINQQISKPAVNKNTGVFTYVDEFGNVRQIRKEKRATKKFTQEPSNIDKIIGVPTVIGVSDTIPMGIGDYLMAYALYIY